MPSNRKSVVFDTNILLKAMANAGSPSRQLIIEISPLHEICIPVFVLIELNKNILEIDRFSHLRPAIPISTAFLGQSATMIPIAAETPEAVVGDLDDDYILDAAVRANANYIVSRDGKMRNLVEYKSIKIMNEVELLRLHRSSGL